MVWFGTSTPQSAHHLFPDATIVWTHRDPAAVVASFCSLIEAGMAITLRPLDLPGLGATFRVYLPVHP